MTILARFASSVRSREPLRLRYAIPALLAMSQTLLFYVVLSPTRQQNLGDQVDYEALAWNIVRSSHFAVAIDDGIVAEPFRTLGYPLFLAAIYKLTGASDPVAGYPAIVAVQALLAGILPLMSAAIARRLFSERIATGAAWATALYAPFGYYAATTYSDFLSTVLFTGAITLFVIASTSLRPTCALLSGAAFGWAALIRPILLYPPLAISAVGFLVGHAGRMWRSAGFTAALLLALSVTVAPEFLYSFGSYGRLGLVPEIPGQGVWWGYWQGMWPGNAKREIDALADSGAPLDLVEQRARELGLRPDEVRTYAAVQERYEADRAAPRPAGEQMIRRLDLHRELLDTAIGLIRQDLTGYVIRGLTYRSFFFWAGEVPLPEDRILTAPRAVLAVIWSLQVGLFGLAAVGAVIAVRERPRIALPLLSAAVSLWVLYLPFLVLARYGLPVKPLLLVFAVGGSAWIAEKVARAFPPGFRGAMTLSRAIGDH